MVIGRHHLAWVAKAAGLALAVVACIYVFYQIRENRIWELDVNYRKLGAFVAVLSVGYAGSLVLVTRGWRLLLGVNGRLRITGWGTDAIYATTNIAKYLPGNVIQFVGRYALATRVGIPKRVVLVSMILEPPLMIAGALVLALPGFHGLVAATPQLVEYADRIATGLLIVAAVTIAGGLIFLVSARMRRSLGALIPLRLESAKYLLGAWGFYAAFFATSAGTFVVLLYAVGFNNFSAGYVVLVGSAVAGAWVIGFITPGASGGIGIREVLLIAVLAPVVQEDLATVAALGYRVVTILGDVWFFIFGLAVGTAGRKSAAIQNRRRSSGSQN